jgi:hypothetical protein
MKWRSFFVFLSMLLHSSLLCSLLWFYHPPFPVPLPSSSSIVSNTTLSVP